MWKGGEPQTWLPRVRREVRGDLVYPLPHIGVTSPTSFGSPLAGTLPTPRHHFPYTMRIPFLSFPRGPSLLFLPRRSAGRHTCRSRWVWGREAGAHRCWPGVQSSGTGSVRSPGRVQGSCHHLVGTVEVKGAEWLPWEPAFPRRGGPLPPFIYIQRGS